MTESVAHLALTFIQADGRSGCSSPDDRAHNGRNYERERHINDNAGISRLLDELLAQIFFILRDTAVAESDDDPKVLWDSWVPVTHVCHRWRGIALSYPLLWNYIDARRQDATVAFLARSGTALLAIKSEEDSRGVRPIPLSLILAHLPRTRSLTVTLNTDSSVSDWASADLLAPQLQRLDIRFEDRHRIPFAEHPFRLGDMPALRYLSVYGGIWLWMASPLPTTLQELRLTQCPMWHDATLGALALTAIGSLPNLRYLILVKSDIWDIDRDAMDRMDEMDNLPDITLPNLRTFTWQGPSFMGLHLLNHISLPSSCKLNIALGIALPAFVRADQIAVLSNSAIITRDPPVTAVALSFSRPYQFDIRLWKTNPSQNLPLPTTSADIQVEYYDQQYVHSLNKELGWRDMICDLVGDFLLPEVQTLQISHIHHYAQDLDFRNVLQHARNIERILVEDWNIRGIPRIIPTCLAAPHSDELFLPNLRELVLEDVCFPLLPATHQDVQHVADFLDRLKGRRERGAGIARLVLRKCWNLTPSLVDSMRAEVDTLEWDCVTMTSPFSEKKDEIVDYFSEPASEGVEQ
ncbi:hypothetical protein NM688_g7189 [Phlebia brevispora]|uniref:Uncharacterized protein n=1 Tax=Phlebia brevispora TaxID=194682 RepID=A0ACC1S8C8_9APHY|nr:hypothetical protein NM688_g7189 [Phlebia brevispora]